MKKFTNGNVACINLCVGCKFKPEGEYPSSNWMLDPDTGGKPEGMGLPNNVCGKGFTLPELTNDDTGEIEWDIAKCEHREEV